MYVRPGPRWRALLADDAAARYGVLVRGCAHFCLARRRGPRSDPYR